MRYFEHLHVVGFEETNVVGNVYYANHVRWQGRVRELFLSVHCPSVIADMSEGLALATAHCSCDYFEELEAFDTVAIRMRLGELGQSHMTLHFEYWRRRAERADSTEVLAARGEQKVVCTRRDEGGRVVPATVPPALREALQQFMSR